MKRKNFFSRLVTYLLVSATILMSIPMTAIAEMTTFAVAASDEADSTSTTALTLDLTNKSSALAITKASTGSSTVYCFQQDSDTTYKLVDKNGNDLTETFSKADTVSLTLCFANLYASPGEVFSFQLNSNYFKITKTTETSIKNSSGEEVGTATIDENGLVLFMPSETYVSAHKESSGKAYLTNNTFTATGQFGSEIGNDPQDDNDKYLVLGDCKVEIPFDYEDANSSLTLDKTSTYNPATKTITYTLTLTNEGTMTSRNVSLTDKFTKGGDNLTATGTSYCTITSTDQKNNVTQNVTDKSFTWNVGTIAAGETATLTYTVTLNADYFTLTNADARTIENTAQASWGVTPGSSYTDKKINTFEMGNIVTVEKDNGTITIDSDGKTIITYNVTVTAPSTNTSNVEYVTVEDTFTWTGSYSPVASYKSIKVDGAELASSKYTVDPTKGALTWTVGTMPKGTSKKLTYQIELNTDFVTANGTIATTTANLKNTATVFVGTSDAKQEFDSATGTLDLTKTWVTKAGSVDENGENVTYTATINDYSSNTTNIGDISNIKTITDTMTGQYNFSNVKLEAYKRIDLTNAYITKDFTDAELKGMITTTDNPHKNVLEIDLQTYGMSGPYMYKLSYTAEHISGKAVVISNQLGVGIGVGTDGNTITHTVTADKITSLDFTVSKAQLSDSTYDKANWVATIYSAIPAGSVFKDWDGKSSSAIQFLKDTISVVDGAGNTVDPSKYDISYTPRGSIYCGITVTFKDDVTGSKQKPVKIYYSCKYDRYQYDISKDASKIDKNSFSNNYSMTIEGVTRPQQGTNNWGNEQAPIYAYKGLDKTAGSIDYENNSCSWTVQLNRGGLIGGDGILLEYIPNGLDFKEITDISLGAYSTTLSDAEVYTTDNYADLVSKYGEKYGITINNLVSYNQVIVIPVNSLYLKNDNPTSYRSGTAQTDTMVQFTVVTKITDQTLFTGQGTSTNVKTNNGIYSETFANKIDFRGEFNLSASASQTVSNTPLSKTDVLDGNSSDRIYTVDINENGFDLGALATDDKITLVDQMDGKIQLNRSEEIKVYKVENDVATALDESQYEISIDDDNKRLTITVPNKMHVRVIYHGTPIGLLNDTVDFSNTVSFETLTASSFSANAEKKQYLITTGATTDTVSHFKIVKIDSESQNPIEGVTYKVTRVANSNTDSATGTGEPTLDTKFEVTGTTDENGIIEFNSTTLGNDELKYIYVIQETSAPKGYVVSTEKTYIQFSKHSNFATTFSNITMNDITPGTALTFVNKYQVCSTQIPVTKVISGNPDSAEKFNFTLTYNSYNSDSNSDIKCYTDEALSDENEFSSEQITLQGEETRNSSTLYFYKEGTYTFTLTEDDLTDAQKKNGYSHDDTEYTVTVTVERNDDGSLTASQEIKKGNGVVNAATFTNKFAAKASLVIPLNKTVKDLISESAKNQSYQFSFFLYETDENYSASEKLLGTVKANIINGADDTTAFEAINYSSDELNLDSETGSKTFYYVIKEDPTAGFNDTTEQIKLEVTVSYPKVGEQLQLTVKVNGEKVEVSDSGTDSYVYNLKYNLSWTNRKISAAEVTIPVKKALEDPNSTPTDVGEEKFSFTLTASDENQKKCYSNTDLTNEFDKKVLTIEGLTQGKFDKIYFDEAGTYTFTLTENALSAELLAKGYTHDDTKYIVVVEVDENMGKTVTFYKDGYSDKETLTDSDAITFTNGYSATSTLTIPIEKVVTNIRADLAKGMNFTFSLYQTDAEFNVTSDAKPLQEKTITIGENCEGSDSFVPIPYSTEKLGTYYYLIRENAATGFVSNDTVYHLTVKVTSGAAGQLDFAVTKETCDGTDTETTQDEEITEATQDEESAAVTTEAEIPETTSEIESAEIAEVDGTDETTLETESTETVEDEKIDVTRSKDDATQCTLSKALTWENEKLAPASVTVPVEKTLTHLDSSPLDVMDATFQFTLTANSGKDSYTNAKSDDVFKSSSATIYGIGKSEFAPIYFDEAGTYTFTLTEDALSEELSAKGYTHDDTIYLITVIVDENMHVTSKTFREVEEEELRAGNAEDETSDTDTSIGDASSEDITNDTPTDNDTTDEDEAADTENDDTSGEDTADEDLTLDDEEDEPNEEETIVSEDLDLGIERPILVAADAESTEISEADAANEVRTDDDTTGTSETDAEETNSDTEIDTSVDTDVSEETETGTEENEYDLDKYTPTFKNGYAASGTLTIPVEKIVENLDTTKAEGMKFTFSLYQTEESFDVTEEALQTLDVTIGDDGTGTGSFEKISFATDPTDSELGLGTYYYVITESATKYFADNDTVYQLKVTVSSGNAGQLAFEAELNQEPISIIQIEENSTDWTLAEALTWTNTKLSPAAVDIPVEKTLTDNSLTPDDIMDETFQFTLTASEDNAQDCYVDAGLDDVFQSEKVSIAGLGETKFHTIYFGEEGEYVFTLQENALTEDQAKRGYTHDDTKYTVTVTVDATLEITDVTYNNGTEDVKTPVFTNGYSASADLTIPVEKLVENIDKAEAEGMEFTFSLYETDEAFSVAKDAKALQILAVTIDNDRIGTGNFRKISYDTSTLGTYYYVIRENATEGFEANDTEYQIKVVVSHTNAGQLNLDVELDGKAVTINRNAEDASICTLGKTLAWENMYIVTKTTTPDSNDSSKTPTLTSSETTTEEETTTTESTTTTAITVVTESTTTTTTTTTAETTTTKETQSMTEETTTTKETQSTTEKTTTSKKETTSTTTAETTTAVTTTPTTTTQTTTTTAPETTTTPITTTAATVTTTTTTTIATTTTTTETTTTTATTSETTDITLPITTTVTTTVPLTTTTSETTTILTTTTEAPTTTPIPETTTTTMTTTTAITTTTTIPSETTTVLEITLPSETTTSDTTETTTTTTESTVETTTQTTTETTVETTTETTTTTPSFVTLIENPTTEPETTTTTTGTTAEETTTTTEETTTATTTSTTTTTTTTTTTMTTTTKTTATTKVPSGRTTTTTTTKITSSPKTGEGDLAMVCVVLLALAAFGAASVTISNRKRTKK